MTQYDLAGNPLPSAEPAPADTRYDLAGNPLPPVANSMPQTANPPPVAPSQYSDATPHYARSSTPPAGQTAPTNGGIDQSSLIKGILIALAIGIIGSIITLKILFYAHFGLSLLYVGIGYGIGFGICMFTGRGSTALAGLSVLIMLVSLLIGHAVYAQDVINQLSATEGTKVSLAVAFMPIMKSFNFMHWLCILLGIGACWRGVEQQPQ